MMRLTEIYSSLTEVNEKAIKKIQTAIMRAGGKPYIVGGAVRDQMMPDVPQSKDIDFLVTGIPIDKLKRVLSSLGKVEQVGAKFGVLIINVDGEDFDIAVPRTKETKVGSGHKDFEIEMDPYARPEEDLARRDFTFNALAKDVDGRIIDLFGGQEDISKRLVRAVGDPKERFQEDELRMLRAIQFAVRFDFDIEPNTANAIKQMSSKLSSIAPERIFEEFSKAWVKGKDPKKFVSLLDELGVGKSLFGPDFDPIPIDVVSSNKKEIVVSNFVAFFLNGGNTDKVRPTNELKRYLVISRGALSDSQVWQFATDADRDKILLVIKILDAMNKSHPSKDFKRASKKLKDSAKLPLSPKELQLSGQELMNIGLKGKEIGVAQRKLMIAVHSGQVKNNRDDLKSIIAPPKEESLLLMNVFEAVTDEEYTIYCDMDGVLVNFEDGLVEFVNGFFQEIGENPEKFGPKTLKRTEKAFKDLGGDLQKGKIPSMKFKDFEKTSGKKHLRSLSYSLVKTDDVGFWLNLEWLPDGQKLWSYIKKYNPIILSSPIGESKGKIAWCKKNLGISEDRVILTHQKHEYAEPNAILIDDMIKNTKPFDEAGGIIVLHKSADRTIRELKKYGL